jgi:hypothetical protein
MSDSYDVGYGKPPKHTQFRPGRSGNPRGRPKGHRNFKTDVAETLKERVRLTRNGKAKNVSTQLAALFRLREKALSGDARALDRLIELARTYNDEDLTEAAAQPGETDAEILKSYNARLLRTTGHPAPGETDPTDDLEPKQAVTEQECSDKLLEDDDEDWLR